VRFLVLFFLVACGAHPAAPVAHAPARCVDDNAAYHALCEQLHAMDSVDALLPRLSSELRSNFTLVFATRSPETGIDTLHPRVILFSRDARLLVAFTGAGDSRDVVDVIHFRDAARRFELERFVLPAAVRRDPSLAAHVADNGKPDPVECRRCHGADPRPIFESYRLWPGFYGGLGDRMDGAELASYREFRAQAGEPYRSLIFTPGSDVAPYGLAADHPDPDLFAPNLRLGLGLAELDRERIGRLLEASPVYKTYRDKLLAGLLGCERLPIREIDRDRILAAVYAEDRDKLARAGTMDSTLRMSELLHIDNLAALDFVARVLGVGMTDWSLALEPGSLQLFDGILSGALVQMHHRVDYYFKESLLIVLLRGESFYSAREYLLHGHRGTRLDIPQAVQGCAELAARSRDVTWPDLPPPPPRVAFRCVRCHEPGGEGPEIPFASPPDLAATLAERPQLATKIHVRTLPGPHHMPLYAPPLSDDERMRLLAYVRALEPPKAGSASDVYHSP